MLDVWGEDCEREQRFTLLLVDRVIVMGMAALDGLDLTLDDE